MKKQAYNPFLPSWEYIPDGEPHVFGGRLYIFGSHDSAGGHNYCPNDYVCWSAPIDDLTAWRYDGVIYAKTDDPGNADGSLHLFAPDVTQGPDGRYYLYYVMDKLPVIAVAVCDTPAGRYTFYGHVRYPDGTKLGERQGDEPHFDPAVLTEGDKTYLYTGFCRRNDASRHGCMATVLGMDMLTILEEPNFVIPSGCYSKDTGFEGNEYFEAPSVRKIGDTYYLVYSSLIGGELTYATSRYPTRGFAYRGATISNCDLKIATYKPAEMTVRTWGNNHGGLVEVKGQWYIFYHRHTHGTHFSRQACAEPVTVLPDGSIAQAEMTSCGLNGGPLAGRGEYPAHIACNLFTKFEGHGQPMHHETWIDARFPKIIQDGRDGDEVQGYITNMRDGCIAGFKYFDCRSISKLTIKTRGYYSEGCMEIKTAWDGEPLGTIPVVSSNTWAENSANIAIPDGVHALYFEYKGTGGPSLYSFTLE